MDKREAKAILRDRLQHLKQFPYAELRRRVLDPACCEHGEVMGSSGVTYQFSVQAFWDDKKEGRIRVMASIDDGGWRAFLPMTDDFIIAPDGSFVGE